MFAYVGSRTTRERNARGEGIQVYAFDPDSAGLQAVQCFGGLVNPSFLTLNARGDRLYAVHGDTTQISAFRVDRTSGEIALLNTEDTQGRNPVHLALDPAGTHVVVSNHIGASLAVLPLAPDGALLPVQQLVALSGPLGPHRIEQAQAKPHFNPFSPDGRFVLVPDKGLDRIFSFRYADGRLQPADVPYCAAREAAGPRNLAFHPGADYAYCVNELDSTVVAYRYDARAGALAPMQVLPCLPQTFTGNSRASAIEIDRQGRYLYVSNRGDDSIAVFRIEARTGMLRWVSACPTQGRTPRFMTLTPNGRFMYALNEDTDTIVAFEVSGATGELVPCGEPVRSGSPVCMVFSPSA